MDAIRFVVWMRRRWLSLIAATALAAVVAFVGSSQLPRRYEASASLVVQAGLGTGNTGSDAILNAPRLAQAYARLARSRTVADAILAKIGSKETTTELLDRTQVAAPFDSPFVTITVTDGDAKRAATAANAFAAKLVELSTTPATPEDPGGPLLEVTEPAVTPTDASSPRVLFNTLLAAIGAFAATLALLSFLAFADDRVRRLADFETIDAPVLGEMRVPSDDAWGSPRTALDTLAASGAIPEALVVRRFANARSIAVIPISDHANRTAAAAALALGLAAARVGRRTVVVDAQLADPSIHGILGLDNTDGLGLAVGAARSRQAAPIQTTSEPNLRVLTAGPAIGEPETALTSAGTAAVLRSLQEKADLVVVAAPGGIGAGAAALAALADSSLIALDAEVGTRAEANHIAHAIRDVVGDRLEGVLLVRQGENHSGTLTSARIAQRVESTLSR